MVLNKSIKVFFINKSSHKTHAASHNRFWSLYKMTSMSFETEVVSVNQANHFSIKNRIFRGTYLRFKILLATFEILKKKKKHQLNILYLFDADPLMGIYFKLFSFFFNISVVAERNELPLPVINNNKLEQWINRHFIYPWLFKLFDGYTFITDEIINFYSPFLRKKQIFSKLPMTVDFARFENISEENDSKYIFYAGSLSNKKDGIDYLINAFAYISDNMPDVNLLIASNSSKQDFDRIKKLITCLQNNRILLLGQIPGDEIPRYMKNSLICVLPRPDSKQARGGFPTKLGEYLASGKPVIVTNVGEIPDYLSEKDVFFISKDRIKEELPFKILEIINNYDNALEKAKLGQIKAKELFSLESNSVVIKNFISLIVKQKISNGFYNSIKQ